MNFYEDFKVSKPAPRQNTRFYDRNLYVIGWADPMSRSRNALRPLLTTVHPLVILDWIITITCPGGHLNYLKTQVVYKLDRSSVH